MEFFTVLFALWIVCLGCCAQDMPITLTVTPSVLDSASKDTPLYIGCASVPGNHEYARNLEIKKQNSTGQWMTIASISNQSPTSPVKLDKNEPTVSTAKVSGQIQGKGSFSLILEWYRAPPEVVGHYECVLTDTNFSQFIVTKSVSGPYPVVGK